MDDVFHGMWVLVVGMILGGITSAVLSAALMGKPTVMQCEPVVNDNPHMCVSICEEQLEDYAC